jgi:hypothetical protein
MRLSELKNCNIYRDGGSLESIWSTTDNSEWTVCLAVDSNWETHEEFENRKFKLYNCRLNDKRSQNSIKKDSLECQQIIAQIEQWLIDNNLDLEALKADKYYRAFDFMDALRKGNF